eukprot:snap_masked-scaffold_5-processed-gene-6.15-mRNA-1 protein AED:0.12 eAED:0.12 QI:0/-1/0/1/-1/1/1/0/343
MARALGRKFYRFSVGGLNDVSEIKGHRRTYVGSMPGKIVQGLKNSGTLNPLFMIDEVDKINMGNFRGDPSSALLEALDPSQNKEFIDHYLDVPVDLSNVLFICTANTLDTIPGPLLDRMEVLHVSGYDVPDKVNITRNYLEPKIKKSVGLEGFVAGDVKLTDEALEYLIRSYAREAGVRNLHQLLERLYRAVMLSLTQKDQGFELSDKFKLLNISKENTVELSKEDVENILGKPRFQKDRLFEDKTPAGVVLGLAWTGMGGSTLYIETIAAKGFKGSNLSFNVTGKLGEVMQESSKIALANAKKILEKFHPENTFFQTDGFEINFALPRTVIERMEQRYGIVG